MRRRASRWHSGRWRLRVDGRQERVGRTADDLVAVALPAGRSTVALDWTGDRWAGVGLMITVLTLLGGAAALLVGGASVRWRP